MTELSSEYFWIFKKSSYYKVLKYQVNGSICFDKCIHLYAKHRTFPSTKKVPLYSFLVSFSHPWSWKYVVIWFVSTLLCCISHKLALIILGLYTHGTYRNFFFLTLSTQHNILISIHVAGCIRGLFLFIVSSIHCMNLTVYPFPCWWISGWFWLLWINLIGHCKRLFVDICFQFSGLESEGQKLGVYSAF